MSFYLIALACLYAAAFCYIMMISPKQKPPEAWGERPYSKSRFAVWLEKKRENSRFLGPLRVDRFRLSGFMVSLCLFVISIACLVVDLCTHFSLTRMLGELWILIASISVIIMPCLYEAFLVVWWSIIDRKSYKSHQVKRLKRIMKKRKNK